MTTTRCALWSWHYHTLVFEICDDETEAAGIAHEIEDAGTGSVAGIQRADGTVTPREEWDEYRRVGELRDQEWAAEFERQKQLEPKPETRKIRAAFDGVDGAYFMEVPVDTPDWIGQPA